VRPGRAADHSPPSSAAVMEEYSYTSTHPLGHTGPVTGSIYLCVCWFYVCMYKRLPIRFGLNLQFLNKFTKKFSNIMVHENTSSGTRIDPRGWTDMGRLES